MNYSIFMDKSLVFLIIFLEKDEFFDTVWS